MSVQSRKFNRVLIKASGAFLGSEDKALDRERMDFSVEQLRPLHDAGIELSITVGGGNVLRGAKDRTLRMPRAYLDSIGMLATMINGLALAEAFRQAGIEAMPYSAVQIRHDWVRNWAVDEVRAFAANGGVPIFVGGTGHPYFSTDTAAVIRALQMQADVIIKASRVDGIYDMDPELHPEAKLFSSLTFAEAIGRNLQPLDQSAFALAKENHLGLVVLNLGTPGILRRWLEGEAVGTVVKN